MKGHNKAQGTLEYLITYGWALILVATVIAVLIFVAGEDITVNTCPQFTNILCKGIKAEGNDLVLVLQNATGQKITISPLTSFTFDGETGSVTVFYMGEEYSFQDVTIDAGEEFTITAEGKATAIEISITFVEEGTGLEKTLSSAMSAAALPETDLPGIDSCAELQEINDDLSADYYLAKSIDCDVAPYNQGQGFEPVGTFTGNFDGAGYTISGLYINRPTQNYVGLFSQISATGTVSDLTLANVDITGSDYVGGLAGRNDGGISQVSSTGTVTGLTRIGGLAGYNTGTVTLSNSGGSVQGPGDYVGGLIGFKTGTVSQSYSTASVTSTGGSSTSGVGGLTGWNSGSITRSYSTGNVQSGGNYVGGLTGRNSNTTISDCYSTSDVQTARSNSRVGGLTGYSAETVNITNSYSTGLVTAPPVVNTEDGGLAGNLTAVCTASFWDTQTSGQATSFCGAGGRTTAQMKTPSTFTAAGWDTGIWQLTSGEYPTLK